MSVRECVEELTIRSLDGDIAPEEADELERLVDAHEEARRAHLALLEQEAVLRGSRRLPDLAAATLERLQRELGVRIERGVLERIRRGAAGTAAAADGAGAIQPVEPDLPWLGSRRFWLVLGAAAAVLLAVVGLRTAWICERTAMPAEAFVYGQWDLAPGSPAAYRVVVRNGRTAKPLAGAKVQVAVVGPRGHSLGRGFGTTAGDGSVNISFDLPEDVDEGDYTLSVEADSSEGEAEVFRPVAVRRRFRVLVTADKPLYQPGQTVHIRALALATNDLRPAAGREAAIEVQDSKGNKIFRKTGACSAYGLFSADFELADQVNMGDYTVSAQVGEARSERGVAVKRYALPRFRVDVAADKGFYLPGQTVKGSLSAQYTFGEAVSGGKVRIVLSEFIEAFRPFASAEGTTDAAGRFSFAVPLKDYFTGSGLKKGDAQVWLEATVTDEAGHPQTKTIALTVTATPIRIEVLPESGALVQGVENAVYIVTAYPDGRPAQTSLTIGRDATVLRTSELGIAKVKLTPRSRDLQLTLHAEDRAGLRATVTRRLNIEDADETLLLRTDRAVYKAGETARVVVLSSQADGRVFLDVVRDGRTELMSAIDVAGGRGELALDLPPDLFGTLELRAYRLLPDGNVSGDSRIVQVRHADDLRIAAELDKQSYQPAERAIMDLLVTRGGGGDPVQAALSLAGVDEAVYALSEARPGLERVYFALQEEILKPRYELCAHAPVSPAELLQREEPPAPQLEEAAVALFSAAEGGGGTQVEIGERFGVRQERYDCEKEEYFKGLKAGALFAPAGLFFLSVLPLFVYAACKLWRRVPIAGVERQTLRTFGRSLKWVIWMWFLGLYAPPVFVVVAGAICEELGWGGTLVLCAAAASVAAVAVKMARCVWRLREDPVSRAVPVLRRLWAVLPAGYVAVAVGVPSLMLVCGNHALSRGARVGAAWAALSSLIAAVGMTGVLSAAGRSVMAKVTNGRLLGLMCGRPALAVTPVLMLAAFAVGGYRNYDADAAMVGPSYSWGQANDSVLAAFDFSAARRGGAGLAMPPDAAPCPEYLGGEPGSADVLTPAPRIRSYFPETLLWVPELITDERGRARLEIPLADSITTWRLSMSAVSARGELGSGTVPLRVFQDFFVDIDFPAALTQHDTVSVPVAVYNYLDKPQTVRLEVQPGDWFELLGSPIETLNLGPRQVRSAPLSFRALKPGRQTMTVKAFGSEMADAVERAVLVEPDGRQFVQTTNGMLADNPQAAFVIPDGAVEGASDLVVKVYPGAFSQVVEGLDSIFQMPDGCFEQTSSTTYPNVLVLDYMRRTKRIRPDIEMKAMNFINLGCQRLLTFEVKGGGFEWYGKEPASLVLTAYGLLEFSDMARVHDVDPRIIERTREWLESRQQADGCWKAEGHEGYSAMRQEGQDAGLRTTAYVAWALAETGRPSDGLERALDWLVEKSGRCQDPYTLALAANALVAAGRPEAAGFLGRLEALKQEKDKLAWWASGGEGATYSRGECLDVETTALAAYAFLKAGRSIELAHKSLSWLIAHKDPNGTWYSTQATVQAMRALLAGTGSSGGGEIESQVTVIIAVNGSKARELKITREAADVFHLVSLREFLRPGGNVVALSADGRGNLACQIVATHYMPWPKEAPARDEALSIEQRYSTTRLAKDDILSCRVTLRCNRQEPASMTIVDLGLPPGFELQADCFQSLKDSGVIEQYSVTGRQAILYFRELPAGKPVSFEYRLRAKYPVRAKAPGASAYQYYEPEVRSATSPVEITVF